MPRIKHVEHVEHVDHTGHLVITVFGFPTNRCRACGTESQDQAIRVAAAVVVESRLSRGEDLAAGVAFSDLELPPLTMAGIAPAHW